MTGSSAARRRASLDADDAAALASIIDAATFGLLVVDRNGRVLHANRACLAMTGGGSGDPVGLPLDEVVGADNAARLAPAIDAAFAGMSSEREIALASDGRVVDVQVAFAPGPGGRGPIATVVGSLVDLGGRRAAERARAEAEAALRDRILAVVAHELRGPLNGINSWTHVLETRVATAIPGDELAARAFAGIRTGVDQQAGLIERLIDATSGIARDLALARGPLVARLVVAAAVEDWRSAADEKAVRLRVESALVDEEIEGDPERLRHALGELLANAVRVTPAGGAVDVVASIDGSELMLEVRDGGPGLPDDCQAWIFRPFAARAAGDASFAASRDTDRVNDRGRGCGLGLGLALAARIVAAHGGRIAAVDRRPGPGAAFTIRLPLAAARDDAGGMRAAKGA